ncbi:hypothetical protein CF327_g3069 [Tilletia walkeri]|uniref:Uncharacterized protein n=1 Tax=Tilletia walkeri TaxID=117179 RepID=A0A8X7NH08_9BASI|nr:hypothetical protein CF327_g3069 [Tilletia walkeri]KAE8271806.1 hypothetical protein A4X09_0g562 [Tilletia walkeri]
MVRPIISKSAEIKDRHQSKHWPGSSAGPNKTKLTGDEELDYEQMAVEDARREWEEAQREDAKDNITPSSSTASTISTDGSSSSLDTTTSSEAST